VVASCKAHCPTPSRALPLGHLLLGQHPLPHTSISRALQCYPMQRSIAVHVPSSRMLQVHPCRVGPAAQFGICVQLRCQSIDFPLNSALCSWPFARCKDALAPCPLQGCPFALARLPFAPCKVAVCPLHGVQRTGEHQSMFLSHNMHLEFVLVRPCFLALMHYSLQTLQQEPQQRVPQKLN